MLKSTHRPAREPQRASLPVPWTEHVAQTGHTYYYNTDTGQSTYARPTNAAPLLSRAGDQTSAAVSEYYRGGLVSSQLGNNVPQSSVEFQYERDRERRLRLSDDRPRSKHAIPGCAPWLLIKTKLGRRFVHNPTTKESLWKFPKDIVSGVVEFDIQGTNGAKPTSESFPGTSGLEDTTDRLPDRQTPAYANADGEPTTGNIAGSDPEVQILEEHLDDDEMSVEYEEVDVTDTVPEEHEPAAKRQRSEEGGLEADTPDRPQLVTFGEEDMARQLTQMGEEYDLDPEEYGYAMDSENWRAETGSSTLTDDEARLGFMEMLDDFRVSPYTTWDNVVSEGFVVEDDRYTLLANMKRRKEVFASWSSERIREHRREKESTVKRNPKIQFLNFLQQYATPKLFWPEFRRKYRKDPDMKDSSLAEREREKIYRDHIYQMTKVSEPERERSFQKLLASLPPSESWNQSTTNERGLPVALLADVCYISLRPELREQLIAMYIETLPSLTEIAALTGSSTAPSRSREQDAAIRRRDAQVRVDRRRQQQELADGRDRLMAGEEELRKAMPMEKAGLWKDMYQPS